MNSIGVEKEPRDTDEATPLHRAAWSGRVEVLKYLMQQNIDKEPKDTRGNTPLHQGRYEANIDVAHNTHFGRFNLFSTNLAS